MMTITAVIDMNTMNMDGPLSSNALIICRVPPIVQTLPITTLSSFFPAIHFTIHVKMHGNLVGQRWIEVKGVGKGQKNQSDGYDELLFHGE